VVVIVSVAALIIAPLLVAWTLLLALSMLAMMAVRAFLVAISAVVVVIVSVAALFLTTIHALNFLVRPTVITRALALGCLGRAVPARIGKVNGTPLCTNAISASWRGPGYGN
jgi:hypothetical protein